MPKARLTKLDKQPAPKKRARAAKDDAAPPGKITEKALIAALRKWGGIQTLAARELGTTRQNVHSRIKNSARLQEVVAEVEEETLDLGEGHIVKGVRKGDKDLVKYYLDRKGKMRGYGPRSDVEAKLSEDTLMAIVVAMGGDLDKLKAARAAVNTAGA